MVHNNFVISMTLGAITVIIYKNMKMVTGNLKLTWYGHTEVYGGCLANSV